MADHEYPIGPPTKLEAAVLADEALMAEIAQARADLAAGVAVVVGGLRFSPAAAAQMAVLEIEASER